MTSTRSALLLTLFGLIAGLFFWLTDPSLGPAGTWLHGTPNPLDAAIRAWPGTVFGLVGSGVVVLTGLYLMTKRSA